MILTGLAQWPRARVVSPHWRFLGVCGGGDLGDGGGVGGVHGGDGDDGCGSGGAVNGLQHTLTLRQVFPLLFCCLSASCCTNANLRGSEPRPKF